MKTFEKTEYSNALLAPGFSDNIHKTEMQIYKLRIWERVTNIYNFSNALEFSHPRKRIDSVEPQLHL